MRAESESTAAKSPIMCLLRTRLRCCSFEPTIEQAELRRDKGRFIIRTRRNSLRNAHVGLNYPDDDWPLRVSARRSLHARIGVWTRVIRAYALRLASRSLCPSAAAPCVSLACDRQPCTRVIYTTIYRYLDNVEQARASWTTLIVAKRKDS